MGVELVSEVSNVIFRGDLAYVVPEEGKFFPDEEFRYASTLE
ncbi:hypothetical protein [Natronospora cellulosivora (SeqCode)]